MDQERDARPRRRGLTDPRPHKRLLTPAHFMAFPLPDDGHLHAAPLPEVGRLYRLRHVQPEQLASRDPLRPSLPELFGRMVSLVVVYGISGRECAVVCPGLVTAVLFEMHDEWIAFPRRYLPEGSMGEIYRELPEIAPALPNTPNTHTG
ncbi:hypothetical protein [Streptomyces sp. SID12488]|uniref:hypothetical protein n=1 Tax=Streptomyces sp. SID12488 TaxID=2706040 RepID=UPI0013DBA6AF|nr:hypothetical protein [Streptomyces sp. SID12488]NEA64504.1 hypothetical protein [Streptomyces sp. SID12488]